jgi:hypothetical protein
MSEHIWVSENIIPRKIFGPKKDEVNEIVVGKPLGKWTLGRQVKWEDNIKMELREIDSMDGS